MLRSFVVERKTLRGAAAGAATGVLVVSTLCAPWTASAAAPDSTPDTAGGATAAPASQPTPPAPAAAPAPSAPAKPAVTRVAVPRMRASGVDDTLADTLTDVIAVEAAKIKGVEAIGMVDIEAVLGIEQQKQLMGCDDVGCMAEIGGALGVQAIISSKIGKVGDTYLLTLRLIDTRSVRVLSSAQKTVEGRPDELIATLRRATPEVLAPLAAKATVAAAPAQPEAKKIAEVKKAEADKEDDGSGLAWPAIAIVSVGGIGSVAAATVIVGSWGYWFFGPYWNSASLGGTSYYPPGTGPGAHSANTWETVGCVMACGSCAVVGIGALWQVVAWIFGGGEE